MSRARTFSADIDIVTWTRKCLRARSFGSLWPRSSRDPAGYWETSEDLGIENDAIESINSLDERESWTGIGDIAKRGNPRGTSREWSGGKGREIGRSTGDSPRERAAGSQLTVIVISGFAIPGSCCIPLNPLAVGSVAPYQR